ncbi:Endonuclease G, mitochondrial [Cryptotermes secundus]|uniref:Endonuclease n=1 Tax=Cryptotermes secundus TaxID=105785 RepID=A0A2J7PZZ5_9NEOP|nr:endonuclease G, mitochondrial [Cryptotermes secundus]PNF21902.1 Endonuclease G, mitochondrial [Cryptotermes secundus]
MAWKSNFRVTALATAGLIGFFTGNFTERWKLTQNAWKCLHVNQNDEDDLLHEIRRMPGLPIFGTVSAASPGNKPSITEKELVPLESSPVPSKSIRVSEIMKYGFPGLDTVRSFDDYVLSYDRRNRVPHWVFEHLTKESLVYNESVDRSKCEFTEDASMHPYFRALNSDYRGSGFDRGHMAAAGNHRLCQKHVDQTFLLSNMAPQVGVGFNRHSWNRLEKYVRKMTRTYKNVYVCTGPLYLPRKESDGKMYIRYQVLGANSVAVPTHFFKVIVAETADQKLDMEAYVMPNQVIDDKTPLTAFQVPPESIERAAGLLFFDKLSRDKIRKINGSKSTVD